DVGSRNILKNVKLAVRGRDVIVNHDRVNELARLQLVGLASDDVVTRELVLGALQLAFRDRFSFQAIQLRNKRVGNLLRGVGRLNDRDGIEEIWMLDQVRLPEGRGGHLRLVHKLLVNARALAVREHLRGNVQRI